MKLLRTKVIVAGVAVSLSLTAAPASAYSIDCAILICLPGGFPSSAECTAAKAEFIRRITPWPVEPPLQIWNCPLGLPSFSSGPNRLPPDIRRYRDGIDIFHITGFSTMGDDVSAIAEIGNYDDEGNFYWEDGWFPMNDGNNTLPEWVKEIQYDFIHNPDSIEHNDFLMNRGVYVRWRDHEGNISRGAFGY